MPRPTVWLCPSLGMSTLLLGILTISSKQALVSFVTALHWHLVNVRLIYSFPTLVCVIRWFFLFIIWLLPDREELEGGDICREKQIMLIKLELLCVQRVLFSHCIFGSELDLYCHWKWTMQSCSGKLIHLLLMFRPCIGSNVTLAKVFSLSFQLSLLQYWSLQEPVKVHVPLIISFWVFFWRKAIAWMSIIHHNAVCAARLGIHDETDNISQEHLKERGFPGTSIIRGWVETTIDNPVL